MPRKINWTIEEVRSRSRLNEATGCWEWQQGKSGGYGMVRVSGRKFGAHRLTFSLAHGVIPRGMLVRHRCDNPGCVNPSHLELGTESDNRRDMYKRGRRDVRGENAMNYAGKLSDIKVRRIKEALARGQPHRELAAAFGVSDKMISHIKHGRRWSHVN